MHQRYLPSATSHYIRCGQIDQYFRSAKAQIITSFVARRNFAGTSPLAVSSLMAGALRN